MVAPMISPWTVLPVRDFAPGQPIFNNSLATRTDHLPCDGQALLR
jgi:hypothetical protein